MTEKCYDWRSYGDGMDIKKSFDVKSFWDSSGRYCCTTASAVAIKQARAEAVACDVVSTSKIRNKISSWPLDGCRDFDE